MERGWHMLKNRSDNQMEFSFEQRKLFFSKGRYHGLSRNCVGIDSLRKRLSNVLLEHVITVLPSLKSEMVDKLDATIEDIGKLGEKRNTVKEQQLVLMKISMRINDIIMSAVQGYYESPFFRAIDIDTAIDSAKNVRRFRVYIQHLNITFARNMRLRGHKYSLNAGPRDDEEANQRSATNL
jgi:hypothetical protein